MSIGNSSSSQYHQAARPEEEKLQAQTPQVTEAIQPEEVTPQQPKGFRSFLKRLFTRKKAA